MKHAYYRYIAKGDKQIKFFYNQLFENKFKKNRQHLTLTMVAGWQKCNAKFIFPLEQFYSAAVKAHASRLTP